MAYFHGANLEINSILVQISENHKKNAAVNAYDFVSCLFFDISQNFYFKWKREIFDKRETAKFLMVLGNAFIFLTKMTI